MLCSKWISVRYTYYRKNTMLGYGMYGTVLNVPHKWGRDVACSLPLRHVSPTGTPKFVASPGVPKNDTFCGEKKCWAFPAHGRIGSANERCVLAGGGPGRWECFASTRPSEGQLYRRDRWNRKRVWFQNFWPSLAFSCAKMVQLLGETPPSSNELTQLWAMLILNYFFRISSYSF